MNKVTQVYKIVFQNSLQNSLQNSISINSTKQQQQFNESSNDDYLNGFRDCYAEVIKFLTTTTALHSSKDRLNEQSICDLKAYLDSNLIKHQQQELNHSLANKQRRIDFSPKSSASAQSVDGLQIKLEEMDVEESSSRQRKHEKLTFEDKLFNNINKLSYCNNLSVSKSGNLNANLPATNLNTLTASKLIEDNNHTLKNYLTNNEMLKADYLSNLKRDRFISNLDLNLNPTIKSRSLTSSPNSSNLDAGYKFKSSIKEKFDAEFNSKAFKTDHLASDLNKLSSSRPRSATVGANASPHLRRLNSASLEMREKLILNSTSELSQLTENSCLDSKLLASNNQHTVPLKSSLVKRLSPGFLLHPNQSYYMPIEIDLNNNVTHHFKPNSINHHHENLLNLQNLTNNTINKSPQSKLTTSQLTFVNTNGSQTSLNQFQDHLSYSSPSLNSLNSSLSNHLHTNNSMKCCLDENNQELVLYPISISVDFKTPLLSLSAILNQSQKSS